MKRLVLSLFVLATLAAAPGCCNPFFFNETDPTFADPDCDWTLGPVGLLKKAHKWHRHGTPSTHWGRAGDSRTCTSAGCPTVGPNGQLISPVPGQPAMGAVAYPYYTNRGPRDFFNPNPPDIGP